MPTKSACKSFLLRRIPILHWGPQYDTKKLISDCIAGFTVGLTVMPQALAYATLGGLEPQVNNNSTVRSVLKTGVN